MRISDWSSDVCSSDLREGKVLKARQTTVTRNRTRSCGPGTRFWVENIGHSGRSAPGDGCAVLRKRRNSAIALFSVLLTLCPLLRAGIEERRSEEHTSELQSLMRISYAVFCLKKKKQQNKITQTTEIKYGVENNNKHSKDAKLKTLRTQ